MNSILSLLLITLLSINFVINKGYAGTAPQIKQEAQTLSKKAPGLNPKVLQLALQAYNKAINTGEVHKNILTVIDYSQPSFKQRIKYSYVLHQC